MKALIGVMPEEHIRQRMLSIVKGEHKPEQGEPKIWFTSINALGQILNNENIALLRLMDEEKPQTITELAMLSERKKSNLSVTLKTLLSYGFVRLEKQGLECFISLFAELFVVGFSVSTLSNLALFSV